MKLDTPVTLTAGEHFSVVFRLEQEGKDGYFPIEYSSQAASAYSPVYRCGEGQSYLFDTFVGENAARWVDVRNIMTEEERFDFGNIMIGAQTQNLDRQTDKSELEHAVSRAENTYQSAEGMNGDIGVLWEIYRGALTQAKKLTADDAAQQFEIDNAQKNLTAAMNQLDRYAEFTIGYENGAIIVDAPKTVDSGANLIILRRGAGQRLAGVEVHPVAICQGSQSFLIGSSGTPENGETVKLLLWILPEMQPLAEPLTLPAG